MIDEPTNHLDLESITAFNNSLKTLKVLLYSLLMIMNLLKLWVIGRKLTPNGAIDSYMTFDEY
jgi:hypothetical protein